MLKRKMFFDRKFLNKTWEGFPHNLVLNFSEDCLFDDGTDRTNREVHVELPYPVHEPFKYKKEDEVNKLVNEKISYNKLLVKRDKYYKSMKNDITSEIYSDKEYITLPKGLLECYVAKDPDKYFSCDYNSYYTSGCLTHVRLHDCDYLVRPNVDNSLCLGNVRDFSNTIKLPYCAKTPIYGLKSICKDCEVMLAIREKRYISLLKVNDVDETDLIFQKRFTKPVLDFKLNSYNVNNCGVALADRTFTVLDINKSKDIHTYNNGKEDSKGDLFQQFEFLDGNMVIIIDRQTAKLIDIRAGELITQFNPNVRSCNNLCNVKIHDDDLLLCSRHYLIKTDLRNSKEFSHFPHMLKSAPCYMDLTTINDEKYLCLAGQKEEEKVLFTGHTVFSLPFKVPSLRTTLSETRSRRDLLLRHGLDERLSYSTVGVQLLNIDGEIILYSANSLGEIISQKIIDDLRPSPEFAVDKLYDWIQSLPKIQPKLVVSNVADMSKAFFALNEPLWKMGKVDDAENVRYSSENFLSRMEKHYQSEEVSEIAKNFLAIWMDEDEDEPPLPAVVQSKKVGKTKSKKKRSKTSDSIPEIPAHEKVNFWIQEHYFDDSSQ